MLDLDPSLPTALIDFPGEGPDGHTATGRLRHAFHTPLKWLVAHDPAQVPGLLDAAHQHALEGRWCVGWLAYEAAPGLNPDLPVKALPCGVPYAVWAVFETAQPWPTDDPQVATRQAPTPWSVGPWLGECDATHAGRQVEAIRELIRQGEVYQVNLTTRLNAAFTTPPSPSPHHASQALHAHFRALHLSQPNGYALMLDSRAVARQPGAVLSVSPELFIDWRDRTLTARPMKGTSARQASPDADRAAAQHLLDSPKERAENLMIVDLLRNDLSRVAEVGSVKVPSLFDLQALPTVWQMTSTITARSRPGLRLSELMAALFPCGSVTGAPKRQSMHHIARLERSERGVYCGAAGVMRPGGHLTFNVPIRTVTVDTPPPPAPWMARCGLGSGITLDSTPAQEWQEWQSKRAFLHRASQPFELLESLRLCEGHVPRLPLHTARMARAARHFGFAWHDTVSPQSLAQAVNALARQAPKGLHKLRLRMDPHGIFQGDIQALPVRSPHAAPPQVALATHAMPRARLDEFIRHKTTQRHAYAAFTAPSGALDTLLFNDEGELTEFTIGNLALKLDGQWFTPAVDAGLLPGVMREHLLDQGVLQERRLTLTDLDHAQGMALVNSVREWVDVRLQR